MLSLTHRIAATVVALAIPLTGVVGGIVGSDIEQRQQAAINVHNVVTDMVTASEVRLSYDAGVKSRAADTAFQPALDQALALVESSAGKASDASRAALSGAVSAYVSGYRDVTFSDGREALTAQTAAQETAQSAIDAATQTVNAEVAAWQAAEDARIAEEAAAAERAAEEARKSSSSGATDRSNSGGSSGGSTNGGGGDLYDYARELAAQYGVGISFRGGSVSTVSGGGIILAEAAMTSRDRVRTTFLHELAHALTSDIVWSAPDRQACIKATNAVGVEQTAQWITSRKFGFTVAQYPVPDLAALDAACGAP